MPKPLNGEYYTEADDVLMMTTPDQWPQWPFLPLKRRGETKAGLLYGDPRDDGRIIVYIVNMFSPMLDLKAADQIEYVDAQAAVDDGWRVD